MGNSFSHREGKGVDVSQGPTKKGKGDVVPIHGVIDTPLVSGETAPSISRQGNNVVNPLAFMIELVLHKSFSWVFQRYMLEFGISLCNYLQPYNLRFCKRKRANKRLGCLRYIDG
jgi:hypothetical protein